MAFTKITQADLNSRGATTLPNQPAISAQELKEEFDAPAKEVVAPKVNNLITELEAATGAANIGAVAPTGQTGNNIQAVLNSLAAETASIETRIPEDSEEITDAVNKRHTHDNKALLDTYTQTNSDLADAVSSKHTHSNKALLDTYTQTESDLASAVSNTHSHSNKSTLDKITEDNDGNPLFNGNKIPTSGSGYCDYERPIEWQATAPTSSDGDNTDLLFVGGSNTADNATGGSAPDVYYRDEFGWNKFISASFGDTDLSAGVTPLRTGELYFVYE